MFKSLVIALSLLMTPVAIAEGASDLYAQAQTCVDPAQNAMDAAALGATLDKSLFGEKLYIFWDYIAKEYPNTDRAMLAKIELVEFYKLADGNILVIMYMDGCTVNGFTMPEAAYLEQQEKAFGQEV